MIVLPTAIIVAIIRDTLSRKKDIRTIAILAIKSGIRVEPSQGSMSTIPIKDGTITRAANSIRPPVPIVLNNLHKSV